jgi:hypothetical protein
MEAEDALRLAQAVRLIEEALNIKYKAWREKNKDGPVELLEQMDRTHKLVLDYIYGLLGGDIIGMLAKAANEIKTGEES